MRVKRALFWVRTISTRRLAGLPLAVLCAVILTQRLAPTPPFIEPRPFRVTTATSTFAIESDPPVTADSAVVLDRLRAEARFVNRIIWSPGTLRRVAGRFHIATDDLLGTASSARREQPPEMAYGSRDQRSYALVRQQTPYEVFVDGYIADPLVKVRVRAPSADKAKVILAAIPAAANAELDRLAGGRARLRVEERSEAAVQTRGFSPWVAFVAIVLLTWTLWVAQVAVRRAGSRTDPELVP